MTGYKIEPVDGDRSEVGAQMLTGHELEPEIETGHEIEPIDGGRSQDRACRWWQVTS